MSSGLVNEEHSKSPFYFKPHDLIDVFALLLIFRLGD